MLKIKILIFLSLIKNSFCPCTKDKAKNDFEKPDKHYRIEKLAKLPPVVDESSAVKMHTDTSFYTLNDDGPPEIYEVNLQGKLISTVVIPQSSNKDWEEFTTDKKGYWYIGDMGNNSNARKDLKIYRFNPALRKTDTIRFSYQDQTSFPPQKEEKNFDCEAFFHFRDSLYLISKNRGNKQVRFYKLSDQPGTYAILPFYSTYISSMITGAAFDEATNTVALLSYGKIYFFKLDLTTGLLKPQSCMGFARNKQAEGISYRSDHSLIVTNEQGGIFLIREK
ncbi:MAG TPA: hypothetical protein VNB90_16145 [Cytophagaceae bacterium]|nr:hypothetical protein [Cytophagaceae bacterium]